MAGNLEFVVLVFALILRFSGIIGEGVSVVSGVPGDSVVLVGPGETVVSGVPGESLGLDEPYEKLERIERDIDYQLIDSESPPYFVNSSRTVVYTTLSSTVTLVCRVRNLGDRSVSWIRKTDLHILTVGLTSYTNNQKFFPIHPEGSDEWNLRISNPGIKDSGTYEECQINTEPKHGYFYDLNLTCTWQTTPEPPVHVRWSQNGNGLHLSSRGGIAIITEKRRRTSHLLISRLRERDSGNYSCSPSNAETDSILVHVLEGLGRKLNYSCSCS
ncbi:LOW QUALITY PROTEIN: uncharacterized protein LOC111709332 [Eurytemora carolleeae]|uniref:LOW QUALITY PROTEIN: uncharacterized protein LOC111709332 n=1 Tax=Eurytemora carolleeae TaxID=1294199 RepID=UPI000C781A99|nr:LOW QUALITY PROTEIN: uncharacterized protein LOC111709332 [Eurytemora carolleeae]|eukprot:XP_023338741.1 LOW QUALITY PROTEIN: uncharacterized protein LOC111709332 [Eurytemora affinis]